MYCQGKKNKCNDFHLLALIWKVVSIHEASSFRGMAMQVHIISHSSILGWDWFLFFYLWCSFLYIYRLYSLWRTQRDVPVPLPHLCADPHVLLSHHGNFGHRRVCVLVCIPLIQTDFKVSEWERVMLIRRFDDNGSVLCVRRAVTVRAGLRIMQAVVWVVVQQQCFGSVDGRMQLRVWIQVLPVQVHTPGISPAKTDRTTCDLWPSCSNPYQ